MKYGLRILSTADADVDASVLFMSKDSPESALRFCDAVEETYREICAHPARWPLYELTHPRLQDVRKCAVSGFRDYLVFYRIDADMVEIMRVLHGARDIGAIFAADLNP